MKSSISFSWAVRICSCTRISLADSFSKISWVELWLQFILVILFCKRVNAIPHMTVLWKRWRIGGWSHLVSCDKKFKFEIYFLVHFPYIVAFKGMWSKIVGQKIPKNLSKSLLSFCWPESERSVNFPIWNSWKMTICMKCLKSCSLWKWQLCHSQGHFIFCVLNKNCTLI